MIFHVLAECSSDYLTRREPYRKAHIGRLQELRDQGTFVGGGPFPDGKGVDLVYRAAEEKALKELVESDPYWGGKAWTGWKHRKFASLAEPGEKVAVVLDGSRPATIVEGPAQDEASAAKALEALKAAGRLHFGGVLEGGEIWALAATPDARAALEWLEAAGGWKPGALRTRPLFYVL